MKTGTLFYEEPDTLHHTLESIYFVFVELSIKVSLNFQVLIHCALGNKMEITF